MILVRAPLTAIDASLPETAVPVDRLKLAKRRWRGMAEDGTDFGFELEEPLRHRDVVWVTPHARYVLQQAPEPVLVIPLEADPAAAAVQGWIVGNLHFLIEAQPSRLLAPDDSALRQSLDRLGISFHTAQEVFQPHRLAAAIAHSHAPVASHPFIRPAR